MLVQMLRPAGPDLARRWLAALLVVPPEEREAVVREVEQRVTALYTDTAPAGDAEVHVVHPPHEAGGFIEQVETTYVRTAGTPADAKRKGRKQGS
jgi:hypothetical protein